MFKSELAGQTFEFLVVLLDTSFSTDSEKKQMKLSFNGLKFVVEQIVI